MRKEEFGYSVRGWRPGKNARIMRKEKAYKAPNASKSEAMLAEYSLDYGKARPNALEPISGIV